MRVLFLSEWYPSEKDKMVGLFVQKHAQAVAAQGAEVRVNTFWTHADVVQLNVLTLKMGMVAYVLKRVFGIPYIIVEHWSGYLPENGQYQRFPRWKRHLLKEIAREASGIYPVSEVLAEAMKACGISNAVWGKVNNVVDDFFFDVRSQTASLSEVRDKIRLLHVSCFDERAKNVKGLLRAAKILSGERQDWVLTLVGTGPDWQECKDYAAELQLPERMLRWTGEVTPKQVCQEMQQSDAFVMSSRYENAPVVLSECMAVGLPIVATRVGGIPEMVHKDCGILVASEDDTALARAMGQMMDTCALYDKNKMAQRGQVYSMECVGKQLLKIYHDAK